MSYINTALINKLSKEVEELKVRLEVLESGGKQQPKAGKAATAEAKDEISASTNVVAKGEPESELKAPTDAALEAK